MTAIRWGETTLPNPASSKRALLVVLGLAAVVAYVLFHGQWTLPHDDDADIFRDAQRHQGRDRRRTAQILDPVRIGVTSLVDLFDEILASLGWPGVIGLVSALGLLFGGVRLALLVGLGFAFTRASSACGTQSMATLAIAARRGRDRPGRSACRSGSRPAAATGSTRSCRRSST